MRPERNRTTLTSRLAREAPAALTISASTAQVIVGMSWQWCCRFARAHGVTILRVGERKQLIHAVELMAAIERVAAKHSPKDADLSQNQLVEQLCDELGLVPARPAFAAERSL